MSSFIPLIAGFRMMVILESTFCHPVKDLLLNEINVPFIVGSYRMTSGKEMNWCLYWRYYISMISLIHSEGNFCTISLNKKLTSHH